MAQGQVENQKNQCNKNGKKYLKTRLMGGGSHAAQKPTKSGIIS